MKYKKQIIDNILCVLVTLVVYNNISMVSPKIDGEKLVSCLSFALYGYDTFEGTEVTTFYFPNKTEYWVNGKRMECKVVMEGKGWVVLEIEEGYISFNLE